MSKTSALTSAAQQIGETLYAQGATSPSGASDQERDARIENVVDADFREVHP